MEQELQKAKGFMWAFSTDLERSRVDDPDELVVQELCHDRRRRLEAERDDVLVVVGGREGERREDVFPAGLDVAGLALDHLGDAANDHVPNLTRTK